MSPFTLVRLVLVIAGTVWYGTPAQAQYFPKHKWFNDNGLGQYYEQIQKWNEWDYENAERPIADSLLKVSRLSMSLLNSKLSSDTASPDYWIVKAQVANNYGKEEEAERCLLRAIRLGPKYAWGYYHLAEYYIYKVYAAKRGEKDTLEMASKLLEKALMAEQHPYIYVLKGSLLLKLGQLAEASEVSLQAYKLDSNATAVQALYFKVNSQIATPEENLKRVTQLMGYYPSSHVLLEFKCQFLLQLGAVDSFYKSFGLLKSIGRNTKNLTTLRKVVAQLKEFKKDRWLGWPSKMISNIYYPYLKVEQVKAHWSFDPTASEYYVMMAHAYYNIRDFTKVAEFAYRVPNNGAMTANFALDILYRSYEVADHADTLLAISERATKQFPKSSEWSNRFMMAKAKIGKSSNDGYLSATMQIAIQLVFFVFWLVFVFLRNKR